MAPKTTPKPPVDTPLIPADLKERYQALAASLGLTLDALIAAALRQYLSDYDRGRRPG